MSRWKVESLVDRMRAKTRVTNGCWLWTGAMISSGYGTIFSGRKRENGSTIMVTAHRAAYAIKLGVDPRELPPGKLVCHTCDVKLCVNPKHLYLGTRQDNARDAVERNRLTPTEQHWAHLNPERIGGENNPQAKLTKKQVLALRSDREDGMLLTDLAKKYGVAKQTVSKIVRGERWK